MSNIIDSIQVSGITYTIQGSGGGSGNPTVELTQAEYDALVESGAVEQNTYYIITDAQSVDISNYWTSAQTNSAITTAVADKVDTSAVTSSVTSASTDTEIPTAKAVYDAIPTGGTGGGKAVSGGTNISITTGETADTINCTLPISAGTNSTDKGIIVGDSDCTSSGYYSIAIGKAAVATGNYSFAMGSNCTARGLQSMRFGYGKIAAGDYSIALGFNCETKKSNQISLGTNISPKNQYEVAVGCYNNSVSASTTFGNSGNTLFCVGNGKTSTRHNAFEIRQNGDIYLTLNGNDVKLQDYLGNTVEVSSAITSGDTNAVAGGAVYDKLDEIEQVTARALNELAEANEVIARALNDLNDRITVIEARLNNS